MKSHPLNFRHHGSLLVVVSRLRHKGNVKQGFLICFIHVIGWLFLSTCWASGLPANFYVDPEKGDDASEGSISRPFQTLDQALRTVSDRVDAGIRSDKIYLRGGVYKKQSARTLYRLHLKGTPEDYAVLSAMPCEPGTPGAVQRKSGQWYENVIFDDAWVIDTRWQRSPAAPHIWTTNPGYTQLEWTHQNLWPWTRIGFPTTKQDSTPLTTLFTVAPCMLLQDNEPAVWEDSLKHISAPGHHWYDQHTGTLYLWPYGDRDPNTCKVETWNGGPEDYPLGTLHLDGEGRALFDGNMEYAAIKGFEFRMFNKLFEFNRRGFPSKDARIKQRYILFEDNLCQYGWMHILLDANTVFKSDDKYHYPRYDDRSNWLVRHNVFFRASREVCQLHGDDHIFEYNEVIDHGGPWAGPAACVASINTRNARNFKVRYNYIVGQGNTRFHTGAVCIIEVGASRTGEAGEYRFGGPTYEYNFIANISGGPVFDLGFGGVRVHDVTIRHNIIAGNLTGAAIQIRNPQWNLRIEHNVFYDQRDVIKVSAPAYKDAVINFHTLPSSMVICDNIFAGNDRVFDAALLTPPEGSKIVIERNLFFDNRDIPAGTSAVTANPAFLDPSRFDFRCGTGSAAIRNDEDSGVYDASLPYEYGTDWWKIAEGPWASRYLPAGMFLKR